MKLTFLYKPLRAIGPVKCKLVLVMKLTTILLLVGILHLSAATYSQNVTISRRNASLETIFKDIKQQTGYLFFYNGKVNLKANNVTVELRNATLADALNTCLAKYDLTYAIVDKTIVISAKPPATHAEVSPVYNKIHVSGTVIDSATRASLPGVNIMLKTAKPMHTQTNDKGEFSIDADPGDLLVFTFIGYKPKTVKVTDSKPMQVGLALQVTNVNDVVVTGYQMIKKDNYTGSAIIIKGEDLRRFNPQSIIESLASFDPSLRIGDNTISGSNPNVLSNITIRGSTTLPSLNGQILDKNNLSSDYNLPIFMLDGFSVSLQKVTDLDINRIASITILKDAAATAVYGSRAANGVIVITTKAPKPGKLQLTYNSELRVNAPDLSDYHVLNASQKLQYEKLAGLYTSGDVAATQSQLDEQYYAKLKNVVSGVNTYWLSQPVRNAFGQKHSLYAEGGDTSFRYGVDMRYETSPGVMKGSGVKRYSGGMNFNYNPNRNLLVRNEVTITQVNGENSKYGDFAQYVYMEPYYPIKDESGNLIREIANWKVDTHQSGPDQIKTVPVYNPLYEASLGNFDKNAYLEFVDDFSADYKITPSLRVIGLISLNNTKSSVDQFTSPFSNEFFNGPASEIKDRGRYIYKTKNALTYDGNVRLIYNKQVSDHSINAALVFKARSVKEDEKAFEARGFSNDRFTNIGFARTYALNAAPINKIALNREMGSILTSNYAFKNKYLLDASFTMDGSSAFGSNNKVAPFWSVGLGWNAHNEEFMHTYLPAVSRMRLTATTGLTGSVDFPPYLSKTMYTYQSSNWYSTGIGATVDGYGNENLKWQKTKSYDFGLDLGLFHDRLLINPRYYYKVTHGLLADIDLAPSTGYSTYKENLGDMANKGYELYLTGNVYRTKSLNINIVGTLAHNTNTVIKIANSLKSYNQRVDDYQTNPDNNAQGTPLLRFNEGQSLNTIYGVKSLGIDPQNGKEILVKKDGSLTYVYDVKDVRPIGDMTPKASGNFGGNITYKQFLISFSFYYKFGGDIYNQTLVDRVENADPRFNVDSRALDQRWQKPGDVTFYKNIADLGTSKASSRFIQKDNLVELKSVYLSYDFNKTFAKKIGVQGLRLSVTANDIFRASSIEIERGISYPFDRSLTAALQATF